MIRSRALLEPFRRRTAARVPALAAAALVVTLAPLGLASTAQAATPPNDNFAQATVIDPEAGSVDGGADLTGNNEDASAEAGEPNHAHSQYGEAFHSLWWTWTAPRAVSVSLDTCGSTFDTRLAVYTGSSVGALTEVDSSNNTDANSPCPGLLSYLTFDAVEGTTYHIAVDTDGPLAQGGEPRGDMHLHFITPPAPGEPTPPPGDGGGDGGGDSGDGGDDTTSPGTVVPIETVTYKMPDLEPKGHGQWDFEDLAFANKKLGKALHDQAFYGSIDFRNIGSHVPSRYRKALYKKAPNTAILSTSPAPGKVIRSSQENPVVVHIRYWSPTTDPKYRKYLEDKLELERNRCKLLDASDYVLNRLYQSLTYDEAKKSITNSYWGKCKVWVLDDDNPGNDYNSRIFRDYVIKVKKFPQQNGIGLVVTRPREPDFAIVLREDPRYLTSPDVTSLVERNDGWYLPVSPSPSTFTVQVVERSTGRLVGGAHLDLWYVDPRGNNKTLLSTRTDDNGERAIRGTFPKAMTLYISATVTDGTMQMESTRQIDIAELGAILETPCGRTLTGWPDEGYRGDASELERCQQMEVVPANLGDGRGSAAPHTPEIGQTEAITIENGQIVAGTYNAVDVSGENVIVGAGPGLLIVGGGSPDSYSGGESLQLLSHLLADTGSAFDSALSNIRTSINGIDFDRISSTQSVLSGMGFAPAASSLLSDKGLGVIASGGGNVIASGGANVIASGGGNVIASGGGNVIASGGGNVIASGGGNVMPVHGGRVIASGALN